MAVKVRLVNAALAYARDTDTFTVLLFNQPTKTSKRSRGNNSINLTRKFSAIALLGLITLAAACSFNVSTANISGLKIGKDKEMQQETKTFEAGDTIHSAVVISNNLGTVKVKVILHIVDVEGLKLGPVPELETTATVEGGVTANFSASPPTNGWPKGKYKVEALMLNEEGEQKDSKSQEFTVN